MGRCSAALLLLCALAARGEPLFLGQVPVEVERGVALAGPLRVRLLLRPGSTGRLADLESRVRVQREEGSATVRVEGYPVGRDAAALQHSRPSFLVDYDEAEVQALRAAVIREASDHPRPEQLEAFVARYIEKKSYRRGQDPASVVARLREGDCKAHAVLLAALARMFGIPARIVVGLAMVSVDGRAVAMGHAWVEIYRDGAWRAADAIRPEKGASMLRLPLSVISDEGPGYMLSLMDALATLQDVRALSIVGAE